MAHILRFQLKKKSKARLNTPRRERRDSLSKKRRAEITHVGDVIHPVQKIESIYAQGDRRTFVLFRSIQEKIARNPQIQSGVSRTLQTVPPDSRGPIGRQRIPVIIPSRREGIRRAGSSRQENTRIEPLSRGGPQGPPKHASTLPHGLADPPTGQAAEVRPAIHSIGRGGPPSAPRRVPAVAVRLCAAAAGRSGK